MTTNDERVETAVDDATGAPDGPAEVAQLREQLAASERALAEARASLDTSERRRQIERALIEADSIDVEAGAMLAEAAIAQMESPDVGSAVRELRRARPHLFRRRSSLGGAMSAEVDAPDAIEVAAQQAGSGDRRALLRYLRLRRTAG